MTSLLNWEEVIFMKKFKQLLAISLCFTTVFAQTSMAQLYSSNNPVSEYRTSSSMTNVIQADVKSERIPSGTILKLIMETPVNSYNSTKGDAFKATIIEDIRIGSKVIIPSGTIVRGRAGEVKKNAYFSRGGELNLIFDHIVTPLGKQIPLNVKIENAKYLSQKGSLSAGGGYLNAVNNNIEQGSGFLISATEYGIKSGQSFFRGYPVLVTVPLGTAVGLCGAAGILVVKSTTALFKKGSNVIINPGDKIEVILKTPLDVPLN